MRDKLRRIWEFTARWRTWLLNLALGLALLLPQFAAAPELMALVPEKWRPVLTVVAFVVANIWMRPRAAVLASDYEASVSRSKAAFKRRQGG